MNLKQESIIRGLKNEWSEINRKIDEYDKQLKEWSIAKEKNERKRGEIIEIISKLEGDK